MHWVCRVFVLSSVEEFLQRIYLVTNISQLERISCHSVFNFLIYNVSHLMTSQSTCPLFQFLFCVVVTMPLREFLWRDTVSEMLIGSTLTFTKWQFLQWTVTLCQLIFLLPLTCFFVSLCRNIINAPYRRTPGTYSWTLPWWSMMTCPTMMRKERGQCWSMTLLNMLGQSFEASPLKFRVRALVKLWLIITAQELRCFFKLEKICDHMILTRGCNYPIVLSLLNGLCVLEMWCLNC